MENCSNKLCMKRTYSKGLCITHYHQFYRKTKVEFDTNDYWEFVKKEMKIG